MFCYRYTWLKDGQILDVARSLDGVVFRQRADSGTLIVDPAETPALEGSYQCIATNQYGTAVTDIASVRMAGLFIPEA